MGDNERRACSPGLTPPHPHPHPTTPHPHTALQLAGPCTVSGCVPSMLAATGSPATASYVRLRTAPCMVPPTLASSLTGPRCRDAGATAPELFRNHPESLERVEPWLDRELHVLLGTDEDVELVKEFVMSLMRTYVLPLRPAGVRTRAGSRPVDSVRGPSPPTPAPAPPGTTCSRRRP